MFDDGEHLDGDAGDKIFGGFFLDEAPSMGEYTFTVYAEDPDGHGFENDGKHLFMGGTIPDECLEYTILAEGPMGKIKEFQELLIEDQKSFEDYWLANFGTISNMPHVDFDEYRVEAINMGAYPTSGYSIVMDRICVDPWVDCLCINVDYILKYPGPGCITLPVATSPYWIGSFVKMEHTIHPHGMDYVYDCPDGEGLHHWEIISGNDSNIVGFYEYFIEEQAEWEAFWDELTGGGGGSPPAVDFGEYSVLAVNMGVQIRGMYFPDLRRVLLDTSGPSPKYVASYAYVAPSDACYSTYIPTVPYGIWRIEKPDYPLEFDRYDKEMTCD
jgi:hypothetical protein